MASKGITGELTLVRSHSVRLEMAPRPRAELTARAEYGWQITKEEAYATILTEWRGQSVNLELELSRYQHSSGMSEWRVLPYEARLRDDSTGEVIYGSGISDTARHRLFEALAPLAEAWLSTDQYRVSHRRAVQHALQRVLEGGRVGGGEFAIRDLYGAVGAMLEAGEISKEDRLEWLRVAEIRSNYERELEALGKAYDEAANSTAGDS
jgi:hypothetical protein